jgi:hypothetical protein
MSKLISTAIKKHSVSISADVSGITPCVIIIEPVFADKKPNSPEIQRRENKKGEAKGEANAKRILDMNTIDTVIGPDRARDLIKSFPSDKAVIDNTVALSPNEIVLIVSDFQQMLDVLSDRYGIRRAKKYGNMVSLLLN